MNKPTVGVLLVLVVMAINFISGCASPLLKLNLEELRSYPTEDIILAGRGLLDTWAFDPEIDQELIRRQKEDLQWLSHNATTLEDFESIRFTSVGQSPTKASQIADKYEGIPGGVYVNGEFTLVSAKWINSTRFADARRRWYVNKHPELSNEIRKSIVASESSVRHKLRRGMTEEQVIAAIGFPGETRSSTGSWGVHEQWIYGGLIGIMQFFYFENGVLTSWQN